MHLRYIQITAALGAFAVILPGSASAQQSGNYYAKLFAGTSSLQDGDVGTGSASYDSGFTGGFAFGYDYAASPWRSEIEFAYRTGDASSLPAALGTSGDFASTAFMLNGYYTFDTGSNWTPYLGAGLGVITEIDFDIDGGGEFTDRGGLAWQVMAGAEYELSDRLSLYGEARYFVADGTRVETSGGTALDADYETFDINLGLALRF